MVYFTFGWPKILRVPEADPPSPVSQIVGNRDRIIFALLTHSTLSIWTSKPCLPVVSHQRSSKSVEKLGQNIGLVWKPDSTSIVVVTSGGYLLFYGLGTGSKNLFEQVDPESHKLRRESDELFLKEPIPAITIQLLLEVAVRGRIIGSVTLFRDELMVSTDENHILRYRWDGTLNNDFCIDLRRIPFSVDQQVSRAIPIQETNVYPIDFHYSPTIGGFSLVLSDGRAAFLTASTKVYDPNSVQGIWAPNLDDVTCSCVSHKYRLLSFGRKNAETAVFNVDDQTGGLQNLFNLKLSSRDFPGSPGHVKCMAWTPDGCALAVSWEKGGFALWSVFGSLLTCSWSWAADLSPFSQKIIKSFDWAAEGYQLWMAVEPNRSSTLSSTSNCNEANSPGSSSYSPSSSSGQPIPSKRESTESDTSSVTTTASTSSARSSLSDLYSSVGVFGVLSFVKSALTVNPGMSQIEHLYLQGEDRLLINFSADSIACTSSNKSSANILNSNSSSTSSSNSNSKSFNKGSRSSEFLTPLGNNKNWVVIPIPDTYLATNWPIRYTAMDPEGLHVAVSGRYGLAHYSILEKKWKLFGNEAQEHDFVVVGGMMWWDTFLVVAVYDIAQDRDELRFYPRDSKLDNRFAHVKRLPSQILLLSLDRDKLLIFAADSTLAIFQLKDNLKSGSGVNPANIDPCECMQTIDVGALCVHPACVISVYLTTLKTSFSSTSTQQHSVVINVSGRLMILHHEYLIQDSSQANAPQYITPTVLASCVEMVWLPRAPHPSITNSSSGSSGSSNVGNSNHNLYLSEALWLYCGQEMRVWLPLREKSQSSVHTFISNRIMLGFPVSIYPLTILFEKAIILGAENDSLSYTTGVSTSPDPGGPNALFPFCMLQRTSQVYLHQILRQLIRRNLGYYAWEIARSCSKLPYFPHSLELLLHEVLEDEATSKEPIPDALLPSVIEFVREFPVYLRAVGQCARKTELALWPHLFSVAGRPGALFDECLQRGQLDIAATYLLIIQNLESPTVSRKFATQLMDKALETRKLDLVKDLARFLKAIDPSDNEPMRTSLPIKFSTQTPPVSPSEYDISMVIGTMQVPRMRSLSTSVMPKFPELSHRDLSRANSDNRGGVTIGSSLTPSPGQAFSTSSSSNCQNQVIVGSGMNVNSPGQASPAIISHHHPLQQQHSITGSLVDNPGTASFLGPLGGGNNNNMLLATGSSNNNNNTNNMTMTNNSSGENMLGGGGGGTGPAKAFFGGDKASVDAAYVDALVERHARKTLAEGKLRDLGKLAAHLDFHLVTWLWREKKRRPLMVTDFVAALKMIHSEFEWPYPDFVAGPTSPHSRTPSSDSMKFTTPEMTSSPLKPLTVDVLADRLLGANSKLNGNDSGYNSTSGNHHQQQQNSAVANALDGPPMHTLEARLIPNASTALDDTLSVLSEESVIMMDQSPLAPSDFIPVFSLTDSAKVTLLNSSKSGIELRFMQQIMWEAGVLDWSLLISIVLRDALGVVRTVNSSRDQSDETLRNLRDGLLSLAIWANTQCLGYKTFITAINSQVSGILAKYLINAGQAQNSSSSSSTTQQQQQQQQQQGSSSSSTSSFSTHHHGGELNRRKTEPVIGPRVRVNSGSSSSAIPHHSRVGVVPGTTMSTTTTMMSSANSTSKQQQLKQDLSFRHSCDSGDMNVMGRGDGPNYNNGGEIRQNDRRLGRSKTDGRLSSHSLENSDQFGGSRVGSDHSSNTRFDERRSPHETNENHVRHGNSHQVNHHSSNVTKSLNSLSLSDNGNEQGEEEGEEEQQQPQNQNCVIA